MRVFATQRDAQSWVDQQRVRGIDCEIIRQGRGRFMVRAVRQPRAIMGVRIPETIEVQPVAQRSSFERMAAQMERQIREVMAVPSPLLTAGRGGTVREAANYTITLPDGTRHEGVGHFSIPTINEDGAHEQSIAITPVRPVEHIAITARMVAQFSEQWDALFRDTSPAEASRIQEDARQMLRDRVDASIMDTLMNTGRIPAPEAARYAAGEPATRTLHYMFNPHIQVPAGVEIVALLRGHSIEIVSREPMPPAGAHRITVLGRGALSADADTVSPTLVHDEIYPPFEQPVTLTHINVTVRRSEQRNRLTTMYDPAAQADEGVFDAALNLLTVPTVWPTQGTANGEDARRIVSRHRIDQLMQTANAMLDEHYVASAQPGRSQRAMNSRLLMARRLRSLFCAFLRIPTTAIHVDMSGPASLHMTPNWAHFTPAQQDSRSRQAVSQPSQRYIYDPWGPGRTAEERERQGVVRRNLVMDPAYAVPQDHLAGSAATGDTLDAIGRRMNVSRTRPDETDAAFRQRILAEARRTSGLVPQSREVDVGFAAVRTSINNLLGTAMGERAASPQYGSALEAVIGRERGPVQATGVMIGGTVQYPEGEYVVVEHRLCRIEHARLGPDASSLRAIARHLTLPISEDIRRTAWSYETYPTAGGRIRPIVYTLVMRTQRRASGVNAVYAVSLDGERWFETVARPADNAIVMFEECRALLDTVPDAAGPPTGSSIQRVDLREGQDILHYLRARDDIRRRTWISLVGTAPEPVWHLTSLSNQAPALDVTAEAQRLRDAVNATHEQTRIARTQFNVPANATSAMTYTMLDGHGQPAVIPVARIDDTVWLQPSPAAWHNTHEAWPDTLTAEGRDRIVSIIERELGYRRQPTPVMVGIDLARPADPEWGPEQGVAIHHVGPEPGTSGGETVEPWCWARDEDGYVWLRPWGSSRQDLWFRTDYETYAQFPHREMGERVGILRRWFNAPAEADRFELRHLDNVNGGHAYLVALVPGEFDSECIVSINHGNHWHRIQSGIDTPMDEVQRQVADLLHMIMHGETIDHLLYQGDPEAFAQSSSRAIYAMAAVPVALLARRVIDDREIIVDPVGERQSRRAWPQQLRGLDFDGDDVPAESRKGRQRKLDAF